MGAAVHVLEAPAFIVTLTGMFLARGGALVLSQESVPVRRPLYAELSGPVVSFPDGGGLSTVSLIRIGAFVVGGVLLTATHDVDERLAFTAGPVTCAENPCRWNKSGRTNPLPCHRRTGS